MFIRRLTPDDAANFHALRLRGLQERPTAFSSSYEEEEAFTLDAVRQTLASCAVFGAYEADHLVGVTATYREAPPKLKHKVLVWGVYVAPEARGAGIGSQLLTAALAEAFSWEGVRQAVLSVNAKNAPAQALYRSHGFEPYGLEPAYMIVNGEPQEEVHMVKFK